ncbi:MAG TPA: protein-disulfide reductase DsbD domain-containing protein [Verrucomicrobiae bacterium]|nr:protein-disulfide reductase DsbD domain-containing protein [Verrucomicrobiae bacterium]
MADTSPAHGAHTHPSLILSAEQARRGETIMAGVRLQMDPGWHTYWRNPGGPGIPTAVEWTLPPGIIAGEIQWPIPEKLVDNDGPSYVYRKEVILLVPLTVSPKAAPGPLQLKADVSWLECQKECVPGKGSVQATLNVGAEPKPSTDAALIETWQKRLPAQKPDLAARAWWEKPGTTNTRPVILEWTAAAAGKDVDFFPYANEKFDVGLKLGPQSAPAGKIRLRTEIAKSEGANWPDKIAGLFVEGSGDHQAAYEVSMAIASDDKGNTNLAAAAPKYDLWTVLVNACLAFLGGMILNVMPCVLPVIALKILGFVSQAKEEPRRIRKFGLIYTAGVLISFLVLAGLTIGVQVAGGAASWGMLLQNPRFVLVMMIVVTLMALNLFGVFEITLSGKLMGGAATLASKEGAAGAFFNGVLATALATPCTAAFLAPAVGFALTLRSPVVIVVIFLMAGLGMAAPYIVLSWHPAWLKLLPKPGVWMERFKALIGFPVLATAVWLYTLAAQNFGESGDFWLGILLVLIGLIAWIWGQFVQRGRSGKGLAVAISLGLLLLSYGYVLEQKLNWRHPVSVAANATGRSASGGINWQPWSPEALQAARATGRPILVDFTAKWCATCQYNRHHSIEIPSVRAKLKEINAIAMVENSYTKSETVIAELNHYQRAGVPLVLVYPRDHNAPPIVLPDGYLKPSDVLDALDKAAHQVAPADTASSH